MTEARLEMKPDHAALDPIVACWNLCFAIHDFTDVAAVNGISLPNFVYEALMNAAKMLVDPLGMMTATSAAGAAIQIRQADALAESNNLRGFEALARRIEQGEATKDDLAELDAARRFLQRLAKADRDRPDTYGECVELVERAAEFLDAKLAAA